MANFLHVFDSSGFPEDEFFGFQLAYVKNVSSEFRLIPTPAEMQFLTAHTFLQDYQTIHRRLVASLEDCFNFCLLSDYCEAISTDFDGKTGFIECSVYSSNSDLRKKRKKLKHIFGNIGYKNVSSTAKVFNRTEWNEPNGIDRTIRIGKQIGFSFCKGQDLDRVVSRWMSHRYRIIGLDPADCESNGAVFQQESKSANEVFMNCNFIYESQRSNCPHSTTFEDFHLKSADGVTFNSTGNI